MKSRLFVIAIAAALTAAAGAASAAENQAMSNAPMSKSSMSKSSMSKPSTPMQSMAKMAKDHLSLTRRQERTAWRDISKEATSQAAPQKFAASVGTTVPADISIQSVPANVATHISVLKPYDYALLHGKLLIVNPTDKKVVHVISRHA
jgi:Protein of unknown function (DUF1236)